MPIQIPNDLPAAGVLQQENIFVMSENRAISQDIRPLEIVLLNLMPTKSSQRHNCPDYWAIRLCRSGWN